MIKDKLKFWQYYADRVGLYLSTFFILLFALLMYLQKIDNNINTYDKYHESIENIKILNYKLDSYFLNPYKLIDYDSSNQIIHEIEKDIDKLKEKSFLNLSEDNLEPLVTQIDKAFKEKSNYFEFFKSLNARATNSLHYLYDTRKKIESELLDKPQLKSDIDSTFFIFSKILMNIPYDEKCLTHRLSSLEYSSKTIKSLKYFLQHSKFFISDIKKINDISTKALHIPISTLLDELFVKLRVSYQKSRKLQNIIAFTFFIFAFFILIMLILSFRKIYKDSLELKAFKSAIENSDNSIVVTNNQKEIVYVNDTFEERTGYKKDEVIGKNPNILQSGEVSEETYIDLNKSLEKGEIWEGELINRKKDGTLFYEKASIVPVIINDQIKQYIGVKLDITRYKEQEQRLKQAATVYDTIGDGILITDKDKKIIDLNPAFEEMFGYRKDELIGKTPLFIETVDKDKILYEKMWFEFQDNHRWAGKISSKTKDGRYIPIWLSISVVKDKNGEVQNYIGIYTNLSDIMASQEKAEYLAYHDSLTNLPNRAYLDIYLQDMVDLADVTGKQVAVLFIDLDRFKVVNDTLGHFVGDAMLVEIGRRVRDIIDKDTLFVRVGGDEFVIAILHPKAKQKAIELAQRVLTIIKKPIKAYSYHLSTSASIGISLYPDHAKNKQELLQYADAAMYAAKESGKDTFYLYNTKLSLDIKDRLNIEQELLHALDNNEFYLCYQPQYDIQTRKTIGVEALIRWENKNLGFVSPNEFIKIAEETGTIVDIGYYVIEEACRAYMRWKELGYVLDRVAINVATIQFREDDFVDRVKVIFDKTGMDAKNVEIEITERFIMEFSIEKISLIEELRELGCHISIDDFGTGYSSMNYLKRLPLDTIKIDKSFIDDVPSSTHDIVVTKAIIALSKNLGYQVVAEGIETQEQEEFLKENGCDIGQGYYFAKPMSEDGLIEFLKSKG